MKEFDLKKYLAENKLLDEVRYLEGKAVTQDELHNIIGKKMTEQGYQRAGFMGTSIPDDEGSYRDYYKEVRDEDGNLYYLNISVLVSSTIETDYHGEITFELRVARDKKGLKALFSREKREMIKSLATNKDITRGINFDGSYNKIRKAVLLRTPSTIKSLEDKALRKINRAADPLNLEEQETETFKPGTYRVLEYDTDRYHSYGDFLELTREATLDEIRAVIGKEKGIPESSYWTIDLGDIVSKDKLPTIYKL